MTIGDITSQVSQAQMDLMEEVVTELETQALQLIAAGIRDVDIEQLSLDAMNDVLSRRGLPLVTDKPNLRGPNRQERRAQRAQRRQR